ncbi:MAG: GTPase Era [Spirochaetaceae bacterium]|nr:GTPase Era [Spirochaetaceae bacterium]
MEQGNIKGDGSFQKRAGIVAIIGRPSAGKSTFLNTASGEKISIVSPVPQTTRNAVRGIVNTSLGQLVFVDTPGYHDSEKKLNTRLKTIASDQLTSSDAILYIIDATRLPGKEEQMTCHLVASCSEKIIVAINKIDLKEANVSLTKNFIKEFLPLVPEERVFEISAEKDTNIDEVLRAIYKVVPEGEILYPEEFYTDQEVDFRISEIIREQAINRLYEEIPHAIYVDIADMEWRRNGKELWVRAFLCVEKDSQKGMVIGKGASMIKSIRLGAINQLREIFPYRIDLDLQVKVNKNWRQKDFVLNKILR